MNWAKTTIYFELTDICVDLPTCPDTWTSESLVYFFLNIWNEIKYQWRELRSVLNVFLSNCGHKMADKHVWTHSSSLRSPVFLSSQMISFPRRCTENKWLKSKNREKVKCPLTHFSVLYSWDKRNKYLHLTEGDFFFYSCTSPKEHCKIAVKTVLKTLLK